MRALLANYREHFNNARQNWKHNDDMFTKRIGCVPFCNSGRLTFSDRVF